MTNVVMDLLIIPMEKKELKMEVKIFLSTLLTSLLRKRTLIKLFTRVSMLNLRFQMLLLKEMKRREKFVIKL